MDAVGEAGEEDVVGDLLGAGLILGVDAVAVAAVGSLPAVVVDQAAVDLRVRSLLPEADPLTGVVNDQVDELHSGMGVRLVDVEPIAAGNGGRRGSRDGGVPGGVRAHHL